MNKCTLLLFCAASVLAVSCQSQPDVLTMLVGNYSDGFYAYEFDQAGGRVVSEGEYEVSPGAFAKALMPNPSYLAVYGDHVYAVSEMPDSTAALYSWRFIDNKFVKINSVPTGTPSGGEDPCYVSTDGNALFSANYSGGTLGAYHIRPDGGISAMDTLYLSHTGGPDMSRQQYPHVHCAVFSPDGKYLFFSEFSADEIGVADLSDGYLSNFRKAASLKADYGPRHLLFDVSGKHFYVIGELSGDITVFDYANGSLSVKQVIRADQVDARGAADIHFSPDGKYLYASLRLENDGVAIFSAADDGTLEMKGYRNTGKHPRNFNITPNGKFMLVACRDSDCIEIYRINPRSGALKDTRRRIRTEKPVFVGWM